MAALSAKLRPFKAEAIAKMLCMVFWVFPVNIDVITEGSTGVDDNWSIKELMAVTLGWTTTGDGNKKVDMPPSLSVIFTYK